MWFSEPRGGVVQCTGLGPSSCPNVAPLELDTTEFPLETRAAVVLIMRRVPCLPVLCLLPLLRAQPSLPPLPLKNKSSRQAHHARYVLFGSMLFIRALLAPAALARRFSTQAKR